MPGILPATRRIDATRFVVELDIDAYWKIRAVQAATAWAYCAVY